MTRRGGNTSSGTSNDISNCSIDDINKNCPDSILENCYCNGVINNLNPDLLTQNECVFNGLFWDSDGIPNKCFNQSSCYLASRIWRNDVCVFNIEWQEEESFMNWYEGDNYCINLGMRLPKIYELLNAFKSNLSFFNKTYYWSEESLIAYTNEVNYAYSGYDPLSSYGVRCVRDLPGI